jgi:apolipoprotein N-acyltransferase
MLWEWMYLPLEFTLGTHMLPYSQSNNIWLIQYIEYTGMWGVSLWLMLFNVLIYKVVKSVNYNLKASLFYKKIGYISLLMLGIPLFFYFLSYQKYNHIKGKSIDVTVVPTRFSARYFENLNKNFDVVELTLKKTDIVAFNKKALNQYSDLYIWPETGLPFTLQQTNLSDLLLEAVTDWESALLTGGKGIADFSNSLDKRAYVSGVLLSHRNNTISYHHKTVLTPGQEVIPYHSLLAKIPKFPISEFDTRYFKKGEQSKPLALTTRENKSFLVGVSLCYEQWYPKHWINLAQNGAEFYTHLAAEGWYGKFGFKKFMLNVTRMRCIENRKQTARSANDGLSGFIDQMGRNHNITNRINSAIVSSKIIANDNVTFYAKYPNWFPIVGLFILTIALCIYLYESKFYPILK